MEPKIKAPSIPSLPVEPTEAVCPSADHNPSHQDVSILAATPKPVAIKWQPLPSREGLSFSDNSRFSQEWDSHRILESAVKAMDREWAKNPTSDDHKSLSERLSNARERYVAFTLAAIEIALRSESDQFSVDSGSLDFINSYSSRERTTKPLMLAFPEGPTWEFRITTRIGFANTNPDDIFYLEFYQPDAQIEITSECEQDLAPSEVARKALDLAYALPAEAERILFDRAE